jgi:hypothetical protein
MLSPEASKWDLLGSEILFLATDAAGDRSLTGLGFGPAARSTAYFTMPQERVGQRRKVPPSGKSIALVGQRGDFHSAKDPRNGLEIF